jgi:hypothetical protein
MTYPPTGYPAQYPQPPAPPYQPDPYAPQPQPPYQVPQPPYQPPQWPQAGPGYGYPQPVQQPPQPRVQGSLDAFFSQPSVSGGPSWSWREKPIGHTYVGVVARPLVRGDVQHQTDPRGVPQYYRDGSPKFVMWVPLHVQPSQDFPDGRAVWPVSGQSRDELARAMAEVGAPEGPPEAGAGITVTLVARRPSKAGFNPANQVAIRYVRPNGAPPVAHQPPQPAAAAPVIPQPAAAAPAAVPVPVAVAASGSGAAAPVAPGPVPAPAPGPAGPVVAGPAGLPNAAPQPPQGMTADQAALLARLTGQPG